MQDDDDKRIDEIIDHARLLGHPPPSIEAVPWGGYVLRWTGRKRTLAVVIHPGAPLAYIITWGPDLVSEMAVGIVAIDLTLREMFRQLD